MNVNWNATTPHHYEPLSSGQSTPTQATSSSQRTNAPDHRLNGIPTKKHLDDGRKISRADLGVGRNFDGRRVYQTKLSQSSGTSRVEVAQFARKDCNHVEIQSHEFLSTPFGTELHRSTSGDVPTLRQGIYQNNQFSQSVMDEIDNAVGKHDSDV
ncbi:hypothetical protein KDW41_29620 [Burkholderia vietnamiensis]|nr:hypothetical protein [Burkholderia vietnamiensis]